MRKSLISLLQVLPLLVLRGIADAAPPLIETFLDETVTEADSGLITANYDISTVRFNISTKEERFRFKLEALDNGWLPKIDPMNFIIRFYDSGGDQVAQRFFPAYGASPGWKDTLENSDFTTRKEIITVPEKAENFSIVISSSGAAKAMGIFAIKGITIRNLPIADQLPRTFISGSLPSDSENTRLWSKSGTHPSMASATSMKATDASPILMIRDDDIAAHADWITDHNLLPSVIPGEQLELSWQEAYSIGIGGNHSETYQRIPAGSYRLIAETLTLEGIPTGQVSTVQIVVPLPYWKSIWFWGLIAAGITGFSFLWVQRVVRRKINRQLRHAQLISDERLRIARDLHDDLGTRLSHIYLLGSHSQATVEDEAVKSNFKEITTMSGELIAALSETVWLLNSKNNDLESLVNFLCRILGELCKLAGIRCRIDAMSVVETTPVSHEFRHNLSLAAKETINNALRHSGATEIFMRIRKEGSVLEISIADNGIGIGGKPNDAGTGLASIAQRMAAIRGNNAIVELPDGGTEVTMEAPIS